MSSDMRAWGHMQQAPARPPVQLNSLCGSPYPRRAGLCVRSARQQVQPRNMQPRNLQAAAHGWSRGTGGPAQAGVRGREWQEAAAGDGVGT